MACEPLTAAYGIKLPDQRSNPGPLPWDRWVLATGPPGESQHDPFDSAIPLLRIYPAEKLTLGQFFTEALSSISKDWELLSVPQLSGQWNKLRSVLSDNRIFCDCKQRMRKICKCQYEKNHEGLLNEKKVAKNVSKTPWKMGGREKECSFCLYIEETHQKI